MIVKTFGDTNVLVYAYDRAAGAKRDLSRNLLEALWNEGRGVLSTQVLQELCVNVRRKARPPVSLDEARALVSDYLASSLRLSQVFSGPLWGAGILSA